jgi:hypothetical protein
MDEDTEAGGGVAEASSDFARGNLVDEEGAESFVEAVGGVLRLEKLLGKIC